MKPPRLTPPVEATRPCTLPVLPEQPTEADLEAVYALRGAAIVECDGRRELAIQTQAEEQRLIDAWLAMQARRPWWRGWW